MNFNFTETQDGSPTLRIGSETESESMHSLKGAFSETVYIYGTAIETCLKEKFHPRILSLGLGLGYVELLACALQLRDAPNLSAGFGGESFELIPELREYFQCWVHGEVANVPPPFVATYDKILDSTSRETKIDRQQIRMRLSELLTSKQWILSGPLSSETKIESQFGCLCFDAFSSKTSPELWTQEFLERFFKTVAADSCVLSTYACTGVLKRALKANDFEVTIRQGFASKRDSTFAVRKFATELPIRLT